MVAEIFPDPVQGGLDDLIRAPADDGSLLQGDGFGQHPDPEVAGNRRLMVRPVAQVRKNDTAERDIRLDGELAVGIGHRRVMPVRDGHMDSLQRAARHRVHDGPVDGIPQPERVPLAVQGPRKKEQSEQQQILAHGRTAFHYKNNHSARINNNVAENAYLCVPHT